MEESAFSRQKLDDFLAVAYHELHAIARRLFQAEKGQHTLQPTALVNEAFLKMSQLEGLYCDNPQQFFAFTAGLMRQILVDHARTKKAEKRGGDVVFVEMPEVADPAGNRPLGILDLEQVLCELESKDPRKARLIELRFFGGLTHPEIAEVLKVSLGTVERDWRFARAFLYSRIKR